MATMTQLMKDVYAINAEHIARAIADDPSMKPESEDDVIALLLCLGIIKAAG